jgi:hypothetical protein
MNANERKCFIRVHSRPKLLAGRFQRLLQLL